MGSQVYAGRRDGAYRRVEKTDYLNKNKKERRSGRSFLLHRLSADAV